MGEGGRKNDAVGARGRGGMSWKRGKRRREEGGCKGRAKDGGVGLGGVL